MASTPYVGLGLVISSFRSSKVMGAIKEERAFMLYKNKLMEGSSEKVNVF
jgi:hypothetical protein